ncbi:harpin-binding protein [Haloferax sp. DFSO60]|uniref:harpin-binding protein n=1 Tax=Haloferax sp. DFSO60 TaxID=3388652 RepID=UPI00397CC8FD
MISEQTRADTVSATSSEGIVSWFAQEAPGIVSGLEASQYIGPLTAATAWDLITAGRPEDAIALVLGEIDESWKR